MEYNQKTVVYSTPFVWLLGLLFIALKLTGYINWSWWWVTLPFWGGAALFVTIAIFFLVVVAIVAAVNHSTAKKRVRRR